MPPNPEPILARPQMEATTFLGYTSAGNASMFAETPVYPSIANETSAIDTLVSGTNTAGIAEAISNMKTVTADFRAIVTGTPRRSKNPENQPPIMLPKPATR